MRDRNSSAERPLFEGGMSKAEFLALDRRWPFLARLGEQKAEQHSAAS